MVEEALFIVYLSLVLSRISGLGANADKNRTKPDIQYPADYRIAGQITGRDLYM